MLEFIAKFRRIGAVFILLIPHLSSLAGHPIAGADAEPVVNGITDALAAVLVLWSKLASQAKV